MARTVDAGVDIYRSIGIGSLAQRILKNKISDLRWEKREQRAGVLRV